MPKKQGIPSLAQKFMLPTSHYDKPAADRVVAFISELRHTKGEWEGQRFYLLPWQEEIIRTLFGVIGADGYRQFRTCYITLAKKGGKTSLAAAVALYMLAADKESGAEIYSCAADRQQASLVYREAAAMARASPALNKRLRILDSQKRIVYTATNSFYQVLSSEAYSHHGINPHAVLFDETHVADREMFRVMTQGSSDARRQPLHLFISTAGNNTNSVGYELHQKAVDIRDRRKSDPSFLPVIFQLDEGDDWEDPKNCIKANPSLGQTFSVESLQRACDSAKQNPAELNSFLQLRLNIWTKQTVRWMPMDKWDTCAGAVDEKSLEGRICYAGLDLSSTNDITALVLVFPPTDDEDKYTVLPYFWLPEDTVSQRIRRDSVQYDLWARQDFLKTTEGNVVDYAFIEKFVEELGTRFDIREIVYDRWGASQMSQNLERLGFTVVPFGQGYISMSPPSKDLYQLVMEKKIRHACHPVLDWNMGNVIIDQDAAGNIKPNKQKSTEKIDGAVALVMGLARATIQSDSHDVMNNSVYNERGLLFI